MGGMLGPIVVDLVFLGPEGWLVILVGTAFAVGFEYGGEWVGGEGYDKLRKELYDFSSL